jgi:formiminotetrahydrofolate cyclodeaminase
MVGSLTVGKAKYASVQDEVKALKSSADELQNELLRLVAADAEAFRPLAAAYGLPRESELQRRHKAEVMEAALRECAAVPLAIMECCARAIELHGRFAQVGSSIAISDVGCGVVCCKAALRAASLNVFINTSMMQDRPFAEKLNARADAMLADFSPMADAVYAQVEGRLRG